MVKRNFDSLDEAFLYGLQSVPYRFPTQEDIDAQQAQQEDFTDKDGGSVNHTGDNKRVWAWGSRS